MSPNFRFELKIIGSGFFLREALRAFATETEKYDRRKKEIEKRRQLDDAEAIRVVERLVKSHQDSIDQFRKGGREDLVEYEQRQLATIQTYLPARLPPEEIELQVREAIAAVGGQGPGDSGKVMQRLSAQLRGQADLREVSRRVPELLRV